MSPDTIPMGTDLARPTTAQAVVPPSVKPWPRSDELDRCPVPPTY
ncbi:hypothetical protein ACFYX8_14210 [Streptomyces cyaneofuscatus]|nr:MULTISPECIES: hypothetical protein [unclassified Streptomyces]